MTGMCMHATGPRSEHTLTQLALQCHAFN